VDSHNLEESIGKAGFTHAHPLAGLGPRYFFRQMLMDVFHGVQYSFGGGQARFGLAGSGGVMRGGNPGKKVQKVNKGNGSEFRPFLLAGVFYKLIEELGNGPDLGQGPGLEGRAFFRP
jgi:hypothetical protein